MLHLPTPSCPTRRSSDLSMTNRDGYDYNSVTKNRINGRDLYSFRTTLAFEPEPWLRANVVWERFREDDNRSRTGKQLCHRDDSPTHIGSTDLAYSAFATLFPAVRNASFSKGSKQGSLYDAETFGTPNGLSLHFLQAVISNISVGMHLGIAETRRATWGEKGGEKV